ncbi:MAG TPA: hypothetical protein VGM43_04155 [Bryobacteraceae bacterium]|jgi:hypothetical protein
MSGKFETFFEHDPHGRVEEIMCVRILVLPRFQVGLRDSRIHSEDVELDS